MPDLDDSLRAVAFVPFRCPCCGNPRARTYGRRGRVRYHRCTNEDCGTRYRSVEMELQDAKTFDQGPLARWPRK